MTRGTPIDPETQKADRFKPTIHPKPAPFTARTSDPESPLKTLWILAALMSISAIGGLVSFALYEPPPKCIEWETVPTIETSHFLFFVMDVKLVDSRICTKREAAP